MGQDIQDMQEGRIGGPIARHVDRPAPQDRPSLAAPLVFLLCVGLATMVLLYVGARDLVVPMLFLSLPLATLWLIVIDRRRRD